MPRKRPISLTMLENVDPASLVDRAQHRAACSDPQRQADTGYTSTLKMMQVMPRKGAAPSGMPRSDRSLPPVAPQSSQTASSAI